MSLEIKLGNRVVSEDSEQEIKISWLVITLCGKQKSELIVLDMNRMEAASKP